MIIEIESLEGNEDFIADISNDSVFSDPHYIYNRDNLYGAFQKPNEFVYASKNGNVVSGLFVWLVIEEECYAEMLVGLTNSGEAMTDMLDFMETKYKGYRADFVINPKNSIMRNILAAKKAAFDTEQQKMIHNGIIPDISEPYIEEYSSKWKKEYCLIHNKDIYWTAERVISAQDRFRTFLAVNKQQLVGYIDVTYCYAQNELYDLFVKPEIVNKGYEMALLVRALRRNEPNKMLVLVDVDRIDEINLYKSAGFITIEDQNSAYASYVF